MTEEKFKAGDVVRLASGGPLMTVAHVEDGSVCVMWWKTVDGRWESQPVGNDLPEAALILTNDELEAK
jgi:uncharacterized protein YodC (DUF2158 family)